jgi:hypothetical protein
MAKYSTQKTKNCQLKDFPELEELVRDSRVAVSIVDTPFRWNSNSNAADLRNRIRSR